VVRVACIGGGPAGLYFALLTKKRDPAAEVVVFERNQPHDTFGFGVVFSDKTLEGLRETDAESYASITDQFFHWDAIDVHAGGEVFTSRGHGFSGLSRAALLDILAERARALGVELRYGAPIDPSDRATLSKFDVVAVADGANSAFRTHHAEVLRPDVELRKSRFVWLGTTYPFDAFTFYFQNVDAGLFQVHAYRYAANAASSDAPAGAGQSTFIVECSEDTFQKSGLREDDEAGTKAYLERVFARELAGHPLLLNRSIWRRFPVIRCERWHHENVVFLGDAVHTAHFSIGSGTKIALEDAIALRDALDRDASVPEALRAYEAARRPVVESFQRAAQVSLEWFEDTERHIAHRPLVFSFSLLTRSLRVTHENLRLRDPEFVDRVDRDFEAEARTQAKLPPPPSPAKPTPPMFTPLRLRELVIPNRVGVSPMCMYSAKDGAVDDFHLVHLGSRAMGGAGLVMTEMTDVSRDARITPGCAGLYTDAHVGPWRRIVDFVHTQTPAKIGLQIGHAGRKGSTAPPWEGQDVPLREGGWEIVAPSPVPWSSRNATPREMTRAEMDQTIVDYVRTVERAIEAGFDLIELHAAHGYLLAEFLSPLVNRRTDAYGGSLENRARFPLEVFRAMRDAWPAERPMAVRVNASDWAPGGFTEADLTALAKLLAKEGCDLLDVSSGSTVPEQRPRYGRLYQVPFADLVRAETGIAVAAVGAISSYADVNSILAARRADLCFIARAHLFDPYWVRHAAQAQGYDLPWPSPYGILRGYSPRFA